ncbi:HdeD family acid-resistance protein [Micropruina sp.]|uniref:HdeD family acid-resistance protein n=1 Tax=Micropruina sp. TaxID=2737536 RepID=UPI0039E58461
MTETTTTMPRPLGPLGSLAASIGKLWWALLIVGIAWIVVGFALLRFDQSTPTVLAVVFGVVVLLAALGEAFRAVVTAGGWRAWHIIAALILLTGAITAFIKPNESFAGLVVVTGLYYVLAGTFDVISSLFTAGMVPGWWLQLISGVLEIVLGFIASSSFEASAVLLVTWVSIAALFRGVSEIAAAFTLRALTSP